MVSPFSTDDTTMHKNMESRAPAGRRPAAILWVLSAATLIALAPLAARADDDDTTTATSAVSTKKSTGTAPVRSSANGSATATTAKNASAGMTMTTGAMLTATRRGQPWFP